MSTETNPAAIVDWEPPTPPTDLIDREWLRFYYLAGNLVLLAEEAAAQAQAAVTQAEIAVAQAEAEAAAVREEAVAAQVARLAPRLRELAKNQIYCERFWLF